MDQLRHLTFRGTPAPAPGRRRVTPSRRSERLAAAPSPAASGLAADVLRQAGLSPDAYRDAPLRRRLPACLRAVRAGSETEARARWAATPALGPALVDTLLIGVSAFFRDGPVFDTLRDRVIPDLARRPGPLRVVSVGCAAGMELYSIAFLLADAGLLPRARLLGIDCRPGAVAAAHRGVFDAAEVEAIPPSLRVRYLTPCAGSGARVIEPVRSLVTWRVADATQAVPPGPWDLALCRNLLIYLRSTSADRLLATLAHELAPGGVLVLGKAERPPASLRLSSLAPCVHRAA
jgi:chemotaxis protein methyltransferase CheR